MTVNIKVGCMSRRNMMNEKKKRMIASISIDKQKTKVAAMAFSEYGKHAHRFGLTQLGLAAMYGIREIKTLAIHLVTETSNLHRHTN